MTFYKLLSLLTQNVIDKSIKIFPFYNTVVGNMVSPLIQFLEDLGIELIVLVILAILGFIYRRKILIKIKGFFYWLFDLEIKTETFVGYIAIEEMMPSKFEKLYKTFITNLQNEGFSYNEFVERQPLCLKSAFIKKNNISFQLDIIDIPSEFGSGNSYKIKITFLSKTLHYRTTIESLKETLNQIIRTIDRTIGNLSTRPTYVSTIPDSKTHQLKIIQHKSSTITYSKKTIQVKGNDIDSSLRFTKYLSLGKDFVRF